MTTTKPEMYRRLKTKDGFSSSLQRISPDEWGRFEIITPVCPGGATGYRSLAFEVAPDVDTAIECRRYRYRKQVAAVIFEYEEE